MTSFTQVQPDGGYGWVIVFAAALTNFITLALIQCFGLVLKDTFTHLQLSATQGALILNLNVAFGQLLGPVTGVLQKTYGCRKVAFLGAILLTLGMVLTAFSYNFVTIFAAYGIITSLGSQISESTQRLAINLYFKKKRSLVTGFIMTSAGFGPILIPQLFRYLLQYYTTNEVTLIFSGICAHVFISAILLQPVEWHAKVDGTKEEKINLAMEKNQKLENKNIFRKIFDNVAETFDLDLLRDPIFVNILLGMALATFAELNFTLLLPFILHDFQLSTAEIATFLSVLGVSDMVSRFVSPYVGNYFSKPSRIMFAYSLIILIVIKSLLILTKDVYLLCIIGFMLGIAKGIRKVYMWLVIPDYVPLEKLPSASGMDMMARGLCSLIGGCVLGVLRDATGSYIICIIIMNLVTLLTIVLWGIEAVILRFKKKKLLTKLFLE